MIHLLMLVLYLCVPSCTSAKVISHRRSPWQLHQSGIEFLKDLESKVGAPDAEDLGDLLLPRHILGVAKCESFVQFQHSGFQRIK